MPENTEIEIKNNDSKVMLHFNRLIFLPAELFVMRSDTIIYLIPGQGSDCRIFRELDLYDRFEVRCIEHVVPVKGTTLPEYARMLALQIVVAKPSVLIGVSPGGKVSVEIKD